MKPLTQSADSPVADHQASAGSGAEGGGTVPEPDILIGALEIDAPATVTVADVLRVRHEPPRPVE